MEKIGQNSKCAKCGNPLAIFWSKSRNAHFCEAHNDTNTNYSKRYLNEYYNREIPRQDSHLFIAGLALMGIVLVTLGI